MTASHDFHQLAPTTIQPYEVRLFACCPSCRESPPLPIINGIFGREKNAPILL